MTSYRNIQNLTLDLLGKSDATTRSRIMNWINLGQDNFTLRELWPFREGTNSFSTVAGTQEYTLASQFTDIDQNNVISIALQSPDNKKLPFIPFNQLRAQKPDFDFDAAGTPQKYYIKAGKIGFWPVPDKVYTVMVDYYKLPTELVNDADETIIPLAYRKALLQYALSMEHDYNSDPDLAQKAMNEYEQIVDLARHNLLTQPSDTGNFMILGPADFRNWTEISDTSWSG